MAAIFILGSGVDGSGVDHPAGSIPVSEATGALQYRMPSRFVLGLALHGWTTLMRHAAGQTTLAQRYRGIQEGPHLATPPLSKYLPLQQAGK